VVTFEFTPFVLDPAKRVLLRAGVPQTLTPRAFDLLSLLVSQRDRVLSKDELLRTVWADTVVEESNLSQQVFVLRKALNGDGDGPEYIATIPRRGYRFVGEVTERSAACPPSSTLTAGIDQRRHTPVVSRWLLCAFAGVLTIGTLLAFRSWRPVAADLAAEILSVTAFPGLERFPSISPDGNFVVFSWTGPNPEDASDLWIKAVEGNALRRLTETPVAEESPVWSPDGRDIAFLRAGHGVFVVSILGGSERKVANAGSALGWTPDGRALLVRDRARDKPHGIVKIDLDSGRRQQVTQAPGGIGDWTFDVSPDGQTLAFVRYERPGVSDVYVVPLSGGEVRRRTRWNASISRLAWLPNGNEILYSVSEAPGLDPHLFRVPAYGIAPEPGVRAFHASAGWPSISRPRLNGRARVAFAGDRVDVGLRLVDLEAPRTTNHFDRVTQLFDSTRVDYPGRFSRDGERVAFLSDRTGWAEAWVANRDGSGLHQATTMHATELGIGGWSPDGRRLVIDAAIAGNSDVYLVDLDGRPPVRLTNDPAFDGTPEWSSDGQWIYFTSNKTGRPELWKISADGGAASRLTRNGGLQPREAPDGRTLFYLDHPPPGVGGTSGASRLMQVPVEGGEEFVILERVRFGLWAVTNSGIIFTSIDNGQDVLHFYDFRDCLARRLGALPFQFSRIAGLGGLTVSQDGRWALASVTDRWESDIMVAESVR
jgi:Tol biopolymer transport system component/DNA-binding winged helix-turn-helix (wHTH) protein